MPLARHVVVVAVHRFHVGRERFGDDLAGGGDHVDHHCIAVTARVILRPTHGFDVVGKVLRTFLEVGEILVRQVGDVLTHVGLSQFDEQVADGVPHPARTGVQHEPHMIGLVEADFDEVVAGAQRSQMLVVVGVLQARVLFGDAREARQQGRPHGVDRGRRVFPGALVATALARRRAPVRHCRLDRRAQAVQVIRQVGGGQRGARRHHPAADIHPHRRRDDRPLRRDHAANGRTLAQVHVRHHRQMAIDEGHPGGVHQLLAGIVLDRDAFGPQLDRLALCHVLYLIRHFSFLSTRSTMVTASGTFLLHSIGGHGGTRTRSKPPPGITPMCGEALNAHHPKNLTQTPGLHPQIPLPAKAFGFTLHRSRHSFTGRSPFRVRAHVRFNVRWPKRPDEPVFSTSRPATFGGPVPCVAVRAAGRDGNVWRWFPASRRWFHTTSVAARQSIRRPHRNLGR
ncbi:hypothetical protein SDC9_126826 [bioreactor metagenome]|uniref:Uncharacterized protein n=1 Tax=bioreactor metagenome TaxID=1076179 RepID=A0A645CSB1_9ZZZZ